MSPDSFATARMLAQRPSGDDYAVFRRIHTDTETMKTLSRDGSLLTEKQSREVLERHLKHWGANKFGIWLFSDLVNGENIGYCGLRNYSLGGRPETELFYGVRSKFFRMGYGIEMARAVVDTGFRKLGLHSVIAFTLADNTASRALMSKLSMQHEGVIEHAGMPHVLYRLKRTS